jgi:hypothetical protein
MPPGSLASTSRVKWHCNEHKNRLNGHSTVVVGINYPKVIAALAREPCNHFLMAHTSVCWYCAVDECYKTYQGQLYVWVFVLVVSVCDSCCYHIWPRGWGCPMLWQNLVAVLAWNGCMQTHELHFSVMRGSSSATWRLYWIGMPAFGLNLKKNLKNIVAPTVPLTAPLVGL